MAADARRAVLAALRRLHRREPMRPSFRFDRLLDEVTRAPRALSAGHRGAGPPPSADAVAAALDTLVVDGLVVRDGRQLRLAEHQPALDPEMRERVDLLLEGLRQAGAAPPRVDGIAARLGIPGGVLDQLRASGELISVGPGIDFPRATWQELDARIGALAMRGPLSVARVRDGLRTTRRHAEALLAYRRARHAARRARGRDIAPGQDMTRPGS